LSGKAAAKPSIRLVSPIGARGAVLDLGFPPRERKRLLAQADAQIDKLIRLNERLMDEIAEWMKEASVTQAVAVESIHLTRHWMSDVVNHKGEKFTVDALVSMLGRMGRQVRLPVQR
jgi:predicted XRE-type DNA-binding protein